MYFCSGFILVDHAENISENTYQLLKTCKNIKEAYPGFDYQFFHQHKLQQISFFACLEKNGDFEETLLNIFFLAMEYNIAATGIAHCKDDDISDDLLYVWTLTPHNVTKHGDPFLSPLSEKLSVGGVIPLPFLKNFKPL